MCGPAALPAISAITGIVSTGFSVVQARRQGRFAEDTAEYNARIAENQAQETQRAGTQEENIKRRETAELISRQRAQLGAANIDIGSGSALQLQDDTASLGEADALRIRSNFDQRVTAFESSADLTRQQGQFASSAASNKAAGTLLGGTSSFLDSGIADKWFTPNSSANQNIQL